MIIEIDLFVLLRSIGLIIGLAAIIFGFYFFYGRIVSFFRGRKYRLDRKGMQKQWGKIEELLKKKDENNYKLALIEADKLLDFVLKSMTMQGNDLNERLRFATAKYEKLRDVRWAHGMRNKVVHEADFNLDFNSVRGAIRAYHRALKELGAL
ncbi:hypothetical protein A2316_02960 [Candidatus Falkowbacteria bacterium RIFOXYB2_FULL_38_15]|uniref:DUF4145 domain-containing protein n=1 Tax=Candidatus Falkowbacteria bacterium RIFOXYA2_FULL_38_12 TaxID=1797993 RepID=A0A1F5S358_9BACT|nr:MAG: hypothetical protein A2257_01530 [Candidatus Falkowbacteria bacterium RIFOXYA2_FULL_38_12]OGF32465.1 MAG: hypothetical protein A2316_02960 [Candidatus Falkowbacteria bacterium RIFOXYB2_FULL_38_15]OGF42424.1 MAG: hypothetical protein A2555_00565 [Candidatus Falkowbacteria bacterium RIFOXYD2_FULL_39_16]